MPEKKVFFVEVPFAGTLSTYVVAESEEDAIQKALDDDVRFESIKMSGLWELDEWDVYEHLFEGNISHVDRIDAVAEESDEFDPKDLYD